MQISATLRAAWKPWDSSIGVWGGQGGRRAQSACSRFGDRLNAAAEGECVRVQAPSGPSRNAGGIER